MKENIMLPTVDEDQSITQLVVFRVSDEEFGIPIETVQEIIKIGTITPIPDAPKFIKGLINVRGDIVPTIDVKVRFLLPLSNGVAKHVIITKQSGNLFGLIVDEVIEVLRIQKAEIKAPPQIVVKSHEEYVKGVITKEDRLIILLDLTKVLSEKELTHLYQGEKKVLKKSKHKQSTESNSQYNQSDSTNSKK